MNVSFIFMVKAGLNWKVKFEAKELKLLPKESAELFVRTVLSFMSMEPFFIEIAPPWSLA